MKREILEYHLSEGRRAQETDRWRDALGQYRQALRHAPDHREALERSAWIEARMDRLLTEQMERARALESEGRWEDALVWWARAVDLVPDHAGAAPRLGAVRLTLLEEADGLRAGAAAAGLTLDALEDAVHGAFAKAYRLYDAVARVAPQADGRPAAGLQAIRDWIDARAREYAAKEVFPSAKLLWTRYAAMAGGRDVTVPSQIVALDAAAVATAKRWVNEARQAYEAKPRDVPNAALALERALVIHPDLAEAVTLRDRMKTELTAYIDDQMAKAALEERSGAFPAALRRLDDVLGIRPRYGPAREMRDRLAKAQGSQAARLWSDAQRAEAELNPEAAQGAIDQLLKSVPGHDGAKKLQQTIRERLQAAAANASKVKTLLLDGDLRYGQGELKGALAKYEEAVQLDYYNQDIRRKISDVRKELK